MAQKPIQIISGQLTQVEANTTSAGAGDSGKLVALDATGKLDNTLLPPGVGDESKILPASEDLAAGDLVNVWDDSGTTKVRKADATTAGKEADGFVLASVTSGNNATVYFDAVNNASTGLTSASAVYLSATAGLTTATAPSASGNVVQRVGRALSTTEFTFARGDAVTLA